MFFFFSLTIATSKRQPIRTYFNIDRLKNDTLMCSNVGEKKLWKYQQYYCSEESILTDEKYNSLVKTIENLENFVKATFKVIPLEDSFFYHNNQTYYELDKREIKDIDFYLDIFSRPFNMGSFEIAEGIFFQEDFDTKRPIQAALFINPANVPLEPQNIDSEENSFFMGCLHALFHAMGILSENFENFHPLDSNTPFENPVCTMKSYGVERKYLVTPFSHKFAVKHFGVEKFEGDDGTFCPSGIELENEITNDGIPPDVVTFSGSHPTARLFLTDVMCGHFPTHISGDFYMLTDLSMAMLLDTGNYLVDYKNAKHLIWGNGESIDGKPIKNFATGPPQKVFPNRYVGVQNQSTKDFTDQCGFNYKFSGKYLTNHWNDMKSKLPQEFYNPFNSFQIGKYNQNDYTNFIVPEKYCRAENQAFIPGIFWDENHKPVCQNFTINGDKITFYNFDYNEPIVCTPENQEIIRKYEHYTNADKKYKTSSLIQCPNIERFKRTIALYNKKFTSHPFEIEEEKDPSPEGAEEAEVDSNVSLYVMIGLDVALTVVFIVMLSVYCLVCRKKNNGEDVNETDLSILV